MKKILLLSFLLSFAFIVNAQKNSGLVKGKITDSTGKQSLKDASITLLEKKDSAMVKYTLAKVDGNFEISDIPFGSYLLLINFQGYAPVYKPISFSKENTDINLNTIILQPASKELQGVTVTSSPISIKKDTIDFNANMIKTKPNATAEDLLKKIPGMEVDRDGNVKAQGQSVTRVMVDGKRFFGDDPKLATRNLPPDMIDRVQVIDAQSDQSAFSGFDDGNREKVINFITKKDRRKGYFGKAAIGAGSDGRYETSISANRFNGNQQISLIGGGNNINKQNFSIQDILGSFGGGGGGGRGGGGGAGGGGLGAGAFRQGAQNFVNNIGNGGNGIVENWNGGLNYNDNWSKKTSVNGSYFFNNTHVLRDQDISRETQLQDRPSQFTNETSAVNNRNQNHRINLNIETKLDSFTSLIFRPNISFQNSENYNQNQSNTNSGKITSLNDSKSNSNSRNNGMNGSGELLLRHRFKKAGRSMSVNFTLGGNDNNGSGSSYTTQISYRQPPILPALRFDTIDQKFTSTATGTNFSTNLSYTEPIAKYQLLEFGYNYGNNATTSSRKTFRFNKATGQYDIADLNQTNEFENTFETHRGNLNYRYSKKDISFGFGSGIQWAQLGSINSTTGNIINQKQTNFFPNANFSWSKNRTKNLRINYRGSTNQPSATQLQPVYNLSNLMFVSGGNPALKQEFRHNFNIFYNSFDFLKMKNIFASLNFSATQNRIGNNITVYNTGVTLPAGLATANLPLGSTITEPVNINGVFSTSAFFNYGFPLKKPKSNLNFSTNSSYNQDASIINGIKNFNRNFIIGQTVGWVMNLKEKFDFNLSATTTYNMVRNSSNPTQNQNFLSQLISADMTYTSKKGWIFASDWDITFFSGRSPGFNQTIPLWTPSIAKQLFKKKTGEIRLSVFDVLNRNLNIDRSINDNVIRDVQTVVLKRYFMLTFVYNLRRFGATNQQMPAMMNNFFRRDGQPRMRGN